jgi:hypothetical protein
MTELRALDASVVHGVTKAAVRRMGTVEFAGFLVREDDDAVYVADRLGTWQIAREDVTFVEDWEHSGHCAPDMQEAGRPVRVGVRDDSVVHEIRPWRMHVPKDDLFHRNVRRTVDSIFTLGGDGLPVGEHTVVGENQLAALERAFSRQLGWDPRDPCTSPVAAGGVAQSGSHTINCTGGGCWWGSCDSDPGF